MVSFWKYDINDENNKPSQNSGFPKDLLSNKLLLTICVEMGRKIGCQAFSYETLRHLHTNTQQDKAYGYNLEVCWVICR